MNKVISREYVEKNYIHKDVLREILKDYANNLPTFENAITFYRELEKLVEGTEDANKQ